VKLCKLSIKINLYKARYITGQGFEDLIKVSGFMPSWGKISTNKTPSLFFWRRKTIGGQALCDIG